MRLSQSYVHAQRTLLIVLESYRSGVSLKDDRVDQILSRLERLIFDNMIPDDIKEAVEVGLGRYMARSQSVSTFTVK